MDVRWLKGWLVASEKISVLIEWLLDYNLQANLWF